MTYARVGFRDKQALNRRPMKQLLAYLLIQEAINHESQTHTARMWPSRTLFYGLRRLTRANKEYR